MRFDPAQSQTQITPSSSWLLGTLIMTRTQNPELASLRGAYSRLLDICDLLEAIADGLPNHVPQARCQMLAQGIVQQLQATHSLENAVLMPLLAASAHAGLRQAAERLAQEHTVDEHAAMEVADVLKDLVAGRNALSADATGYLLRSFFETIRRHVHAERELLDLLEDLRPMRGSVH